MVGVDLSKNFLLCIISSVWMCPSRETWSYKPFWYVYPNTFGIDDTFIYVNHIKFYARHYIVLWTTLKGKQSWFLLLFKDKANLHLIITIHWPSSTLLRLSFNFTGQPPIKTCRFYPNLAKMASPAKRWKVKLMGTQFACICWSIPHVVKNWGAVCGNPFARHFILLTFDSLIPQNN